MITAQPHLVPALAAATGAGLTLGTHVPKADLVALATTGATGFTGLFLCLTTLFLGLDGHSYHRLLVQ